MQAVRHVIVMQHGLGGLPSDWGPVVRALDATGRPCDVLRPPDNSSDPARGPTMRFLFPGPNGDGVAACAGRLVAAMLRDVRTPCSLSVAGHSMGGLIMRAALERLAAEHPEWWAQITPESFVTVATPHTGVNRFFGTLMSLRYGSNMLKGGQGPAEPWLSPVLRQFRRIVLYACPDDPIIPFSSATAGGRVPLRTPTSAPGGSFSTRDSPQSLPGAPRSPPAGAAPSAKSAPAPAADPAAAPEGLACCVAAPRPPRLPSSRRRGATASLVRCDVESPRGAQEAGRAASPPGSGSPPDAPMPTVARWCVFARKGAQGHTMGVVVDDPDLDDSAARHVAEQLLPAPLDASPGAAAASPPPLPVSDPYGAAQADGAGPESAPAFPPPPAPSPSDRGTAAHADPAAAAPFPPPPPPEAAEPYGGE
eukprot:TRINITY_DN5794_c1_g1_i1.p1 TRINITY_DN5794_c1_g1~~TRINITY_DN5794_c1_g1_i1.p1  ORF type:complete len:450 (+),score=103.30 TRINITY_DN5794_c1_g1_i1:87-1352(+)